MKYNLNRVKPRTLFGLNESVVRKYTNNHKAQIRILKFILKGRGKIV